MPRLPKGVSRCGKKGKIRFQARLCRNGQIIHIGVFGSPEEAGDAYRAASSSRAINPAATAPASPREVLQEEPAPLPTDVPQALAATAPQGCVSFGRSLCNGGD